MICKLKKEKIKVYLYPRVSITMQIVGYSLDAQKTKMKAFCDYNEYEIAGEYEDAGKSGKSIEGRVSFNQMMEDIKSGIRSKINMEVDTGALDQEIEKTNSLL